MLGAVSGGAVTYLTRRSEFRRDERLKTYAAFITAFQEVALSGANLASVHMTWGLHYEPGSNPESTERKRAAYGMAFELHAPNRARYEDASARIRMVASSEVIDAADVVDDWLNSNVYGAPPFSQDLTEAGPVARQGPGPVGRAIPGVIRAFTDVARTDIVGG